MAFKHEIFSEHVFSLQPKLTFDDCFRKENIHIRSCMLKTESNVFVGNATLKRRQLFMLTK